VRDAKPWADTTQAQLGETTQLHDDVVQLQNGNSEARGKGRGGQQHIRRRNLIGLPVSPHYKKRCGTGQIT
jgi:hypothetical protein